MICTKLFRHFLVNELNNSDKNGIWKFNVFRYEKLKKKKESFKENYLKNEIALLKSVKGKRRGGHCCLSLWLNFELTRFIAWRGRKKEKLYSSETYDPPERGPRCNVIVANLQQVNDILSVVEEWAAAVVKLINFGHPRSASALRATISTERRESINHF